MITAFEAKSITAGMIDEKKAAELLEGMDGFIRMEASKGKSFAKPEPSNFTDAERAFLRKKLAEQGFNVSETGLTIYW